MASNTTVTETKRKAKARSHGKARKRALESKGTTPSYRELFGEGK